MIEDGTAEASRGGGGGLRLNVQPPAWDDFSSGEDSDQEDDERFVPRSYLCDKWLTLNSSTLQASLSVASTEKISKYTFIVRAFGIKISPGRTLFSYTFQYNQ